MQTNTKKTIKSIVALFLAVVVAFGCAYLLRNFVIGRYAVEGFSMEPNYHDGQKLYGLKIGSPKHGSVVVINVAGMAEPLLKRVVGLAGDKLWTEDGVLCRMRFGSEETEKLTNESYGGNLLDIMDSGIEPVIIQEGYCFVLGDNRTGLNSMDSRVFGQVKLKDIIAIIPFSAK